MDKFFWDDLLKKQNHAGFKAKADVVAILLKLGYKPIRRYFGRNRLEKAISFVSRFIFGKTFMPKNSILFVQYPCFLPFLFFYKMMWKIKKIKTILLIHDVNGFRFKNDRLFKKEIKLFNSFDVVITHNDKMTKLLKNHGFKTKTVELGIFDYLFDGSKNFDDSKKYHKDSVTIAYVGLLSKGRGGFVYDLNKIASKKLSFHLYGNGYEKSLSDRGNFLKYEGSFPPETLPLVCNEDFGMVWGGDDFNFCSGNYGDYFKINDPHKTSLYLVSGLPVIVWKSAAISDFIVKNNLGIAIDSLYDLKKALADLSEQDYYVMRSNVLKISQKLQEGYYLTKALSKSCSLLEEI